MSSIDEDLSPSVEPIAANAFVQRSAKGTFIRKNKILEKLLETKNKNDTETWKSIVANEGSVDHLDFLNKEEKSIFLTAREINQFVIIKQAADRQKYIDQGQSINLFFSMNATPKYMSEVAKEAWKEGLKSLYYCRTSSVLKGDSGSRGYERKIEDCVWCE
jgi:ribonucleoside-diphosphate reductase alpha chain